MTPEQALRNDTTQTKLERHITMDPAHTWAHVGSDVNTGAVVRRSEWLSEHDADETWVRARRKHKTSFE